MEQLTFGDAPAPAPAPAVGGVRPLGPAQATGYELERELAGARPGGAARIAGVDEVGRGAWAGPSWSAPWSSGLASLTRPTG